MIYAKFVQHFSVELSFFDNRFYQRNFATNIYQLAMILLYLLTKMRKNSLSGTGLRIVDFVLDGKLSLMLTDYSREMS